MKKIYLVKHYFTVDGGYGDAIPNEEVVTSFENEEDAQAFVEKYKNDHVYDTPYNDLECGELAVEEMNVLSHDDSQNIAWKWVNSRHGEGHLYTEEEALKHLTCHIERLSPFDYFDESVREGHIKGTIEDLACMYSVEESFIRELLIKAGKIK